MMRKDEIHDLIEHIAAIQQIVDDNRVFNVTVYPAHMHYITQTQVHLQLEEYTDMFEKTDRESYTNTYDKLSVILGGTEFFALTEVEK